jgi:DNA-directed RNA polymerase specialized sigma24 family protein
MVPDPALLAEQNESYVRIRHAVADLPANQREAVLLYAEGFSYREIAAITARTEGSVRVIVHRALVRLRAHPQLQYLNDQQQSESVAAPSAAVAGRIPSTRV